MGVKKSDVAGNGQCQGGQHWVVAVVTQAPGQGHSLVLCSAVATLCDFNKFYTEDAVI